MLAFMAARASAGPLKPGDSFPDLSAFGLEGTIPDAKGKVVLIDFFASWCTPCHESFPVMEELHKRFGEKGLVIVAVSVDKKKQDLERFLKKHSAAFAIARDPAGKLAAEVKIPTMPTSFIVDRQGVVRAVHRGFHGEETRKKYVSEIEELLK
jgi:thiol-disulfide isomerase/thioredoxin